MRKLFCPILIITLFAFGKMELAAQTVARPVKLVQYALDSFATGTVYMKSGQTYQQILNYNILTGELIFDGGNGLRAINDPADVTKAVIAGRTFLPMDDKFYELLVDGESPLYKEFTFTIQQPGNSIGYGMTSNTTAASPLKELMRNGSAYNLKLPDEFVVTTAANYWIKKDDKLSKVSNEKQLTKLFPDKKGEINEYVKAHHTDFSKENDLVELVRAIAL